MRFVLLIFFSRRGSTDYQVCQVYAIWDVVGYYVYPLSGWCVIHLRFRVQQY